MNQTPVLINTSVVRLSDYHADGIQLQFALGDSLKSFAFQLCIPSTPLEVARGFRSVADAIEEFGDVAKWE